ncbi:MAG: D-lyxose/D-mannose family sugar isomerase [Candidatus Cloacimonetes bacterium]|nr:D-lyxose/D-mannose family sugar isomerase [Candidatus Cloacimonadota bacterium]
MKRSEVNGYIKEAEQIMANRSFFLPQWASWTLDEWSKNKSKCTEILDSMLGWDITDFGSGNYLKTGLFLFTLRNGNPDRNTKTYAEKIMIVKENQECPLHFHWHKNEDIINRGGGILVFQLFKATRDEQLSEDDVLIQVDGITTVLKAGEKLELVNGQSICLSPGIYHRFYAKKGTGYVLAGEVSSINDDTTDNRFFKPAGRFPIIEENAKPYRLLVSDYGTLLN